jgi:hypothetical protein
LHIDAEHALIGVESILRNQVKRSYPRYWNEDTITLNILRAFETLLYNLEIEGPFEQEIKVNWQAFKFSGKAEHTFGDVAILVHVNYYDGDSIEGAAFLEAKKRYKNQTKFEAMKKKQLRHIYHNAQTSMALLFDYEDITSFAHTDLFQTSLKRYNGLFWKPGTSAVTVPIKTILATNKGDTSVYKFSVPFSYQLFFRYFQAFDLEFSEPPISIAKGFALKIGAPKYLAVVSVGMGTEPAQEITYEREVFRTVKDEE